MKRIYRYFSPPRKLALLNGILIAIILAFNTYFQAFCIPTPWAIAFLVICFTGTVVYPLIAVNRWLLALTGFINGLSFCVFLYCVLFMEQLNLFGLLTTMFGIGFVVLIPHFFMIQLVWRSVFRPAARVVRYGFLSAVLVCGITVYYVGQEYGRAITAIEAFEQSSYTQLEKGFMTEKILGMHFIYHTRFCELDGWRPPKHEPILVIGMWLNGRNDPLHVDLETRLELYKKFFSENRYKFNCSCGIQYRESYHNDPLWR